MTLVLSLVIEWLTYVLFVVTTKGNFAAPFSTSDTTDIDIGPVAFVTSIDF
jgi:hypothetical protein